MNTETELKFRLDDPAAMRQRILQAGGQPLGSVLEENTYFDTPGQKLRQRDSGLRVRVATAPDGKTSTLLTYKGKRLQKDAFVRPEENLPAESPESARAFVEGLGFRPFVTFQKRRESFQLGPARVELDELPELGQFMEIEADNEAAVTAARQQLGLADTPPVTQTYLAMVMQLLADRSEKALRF